jgi:hypothetical protein
MINQKFCAKALLSFFSLHAFGTGSNVKIKTKNWKSALPIS